MRKSITLRGDGQGIWKNDPKNVPNSRTEVQSWINGSELIQQGLESEDD